MSVIALISIFLTLQPTSYSHQPTKAQTQFWTKHNRELREVGLNSRVANLVERPYAEYEKAQYLIMDTTDSFESHSTKIAIIQNLPPEIELVFIDKYSNPNLVDHARQILGDQRVHIISYTNGKGFWARDALPIPTFAHSGTAFNFVVVDAKYYHDFDEDQIVASHFRAKTIRHAYGFEGGNFISDSRGRCLLVNNSRHAEIPDSIFNQYYGCRSVVRFPHVSGIGHIDERIKLISDTLAVTDTTEYVDVLKKMGFEVRLLPRSPESFESYANSILLNQTLLMPTYRQTTDQEALEVYKSLGLNVVSIDAKELSKGHGSIHCISMTYPPAPFQKVADALGTIRE